MFGQLEQTQALIDTLEPSRVESFDSLLLQVITGYNQRLSDNITIGGSYRFSWNEYEEDTTSGEIRKGDLFGHSFLVTATWAFSYEDSVIPSTGDLMYSPYVSFSIGPIIHQDMNPDVTTPTSSISSGYDSDVGFDLNGAIGFFPHRLIRTELAVGFRQWKADLEIELDRVGFVDAINVDAVNTEFNATTISFNTYLHFTGKESTYQPYIGFGVGGVFGQLEDTQSLLAILESSRVESFDSLLLQVITGYNHRLSDNITIGGSYRFSWSEYEEDTTLGTILKDDLFGHGFLVTFMWGF